MRSYTGSRRNMRFRLFLMVVWCHWACGVEFTDCVQTVGGDYYREELLAEDAAMHDEVVYDMNNDKIYVLKELTLGFESEFEVHVWDEEEKSFNKFADLPAMCRLTTDQSLGRLFAGCWNNTGRGGLYIYDSNPQQFISLTNEVHRANGIYFADKLYYTNSEHELQSFTQGRIQPVPELKGIKLWYAVKDGSGGWVFTIDGRIYHKSGSMIRPVGLMSPVSITRLAVNPRGDVYSGSYVGGVYRIDTASNNVIKVLDTPTYCYDLAIDKDGSIICLISKYSGAARIVRYKKCLPQLFIN